MAGPVLGKVKRFLPRTLFGRSLLILVIPVVLIQIITSFVFFDRHWGKVTTRLAYGVSGEIAVITASLKDADDPAKVERIKDYAKRFLVLDVEYKPGKNLPRAEESSIVEIWEAVVADKLSGELRSKIDEQFVIHTDFNQKMIEVFVQLESGLLRVSFPQRRLFSSSGYVFLLWMLGTSLLLLIVAIVFMRNQVRPIRKLAAAAGLFGKGRDTPFFKPEGAKEVREAGAAFMDMRRRIQRQISQRTEMLAGVSHDLRTPLTRMKLQVEMMPDGADKDEMRQDILDMQRMIDGYLDFVRGDGEEEFDNIDVMGVLHRLAQTFSKDGLQVNITGQAVHIVARPLAFDRAIGNLINNAAKYAGHLYIHVSSDGEKVQIDFEDDGPGIEDDQYKAVFKPFYRVDSSRNAETGGVGLGLPIVMDIVHGHGGKIWLEKSSEHGGLKVVVRMPL